MCAAYIWLYLSHVCFVKVMYSVDISSKIDLVERLRVLESVSMNYYNIVRICKAFFDNDTSWFTEDAPHTRVCITCKDGAPFLHPQAIDCHVDPPKAISRTSTGLDDHGREAAFHWYENSASGWNYIVCKNATDMMTALCENFIRDPSVRANVIAKIKPLPAPIDPITAAREKTHAAFMERAFNNNEFDAWMALVQEIKAEYRNVRNIVKAELQTNLK